MYWPKNNGEFEPEIFSMALAVIHEYPYAELLPASMVSVVNSILGDDIEGLVYLEDKWTLVILDNCYTFTDCSVDNFLNVIEKLKKYLSSDPTEGTTLEQHNFYTQFKECNIIGFMSYKESDDYAIELAQLNSIWTSCVDDYKL